MWSQYCDYTFVDSIHIYIYIYIQYCVVENLKFTINSQCYLNTKHEIIKFSVLVKLCIIQVFLSSILKITIVVAEIIKKRSDIIHFHSTHILKLELT